MIKPKGSSFSTIKSLFYDKCTFHLKNIHSEKESKEYDARTFELNGFKIIYRQAKITPTKTGQFVTLWKRIENGPIEPFHINDDFDFAIITTRKDDLLGQFIFPKSILLKKGIISNESKEGKRGFRVYPPWDITMNKQAKKSQEWQLDYFVEIDEKNAIDTERLKKIFKF